MFSKNKKLILCMTPLQIIIALKIIEINGEKYDYDVYVLSYTYNNKYKHYCELLKSKGVILTFLLLKNSNIFIRLFSFFKLKRVFSGKEYSSVYVASIDNVNIYTVLSNIKFEKIFTFDDGTANIFKGSNYYICKKNNFIMKILGLDWDIEKIKNKTSLHYTIYKNFSNIVEHTLFLNLFYSANYLVEKSINLYLGQALDGENKSLSLDIYNKLSENISILLYFPHPREMEIQLDDSLIIDSDLIVEDYILNLLKDGYCINLYSFCSTAAFNLVSIENVTVNFIRTVQTKDKFSLVYDFIESNRMNLMEV